jgi:hypothetical protein
VSDEPTPLDRVRARPENPHAFRGFGPLLALAVLVLLSILLAPTVAPEQIVLQPSDSTTSTVATATTTTTATTPTTGATATTAAAPTTGQTATTAAEAGG